MPADAGFTRRARTGRAPPLGGIWIAGPVHGGPAVGARWLGRGLLPRAAHLAGGGRGSLVAGRSPGSSTARSSRAHSHGDDGPRLGGGAQHIQRRLRRHPRNLHLAVSLLLARANRGRAEAPPGDRLARRARPHGTDDGPALREVGLLAPCVPNGHRARARVGPARPLWDPRLSELAPPERSPGDVPSPGDPPLDGGRARARRPLHRPLCRTPRHQPVAGWAPPRCSRSVFLRVQSPRLPTPHSGPDGARRRGIRGRRLPAAPRLARAVLHVVAGSPGKQLHDLVVSRPHSLLVQSLPRRCALGPGARAGRRSGGLRCPARSLGCRRPAPRRPHVDDPAVLVPLGGPEGLVGETPTAPGVSRPSHPSPPWASRRSSNASPDDCVWSSPAAWCSGPRSR